jgi:hypothetical protein
MAKKYSVLVMAEVTKDEVVADVRIAICRRVRKGNECNFRWTPAKEPMKLESGQWRATGGAIVDNLQEKYPRLVVKRQEITAHYTKQLTAFREFLTRRITS